MALEEATPFGDNRITICSHTGEVTIPSPDLDGCRKIKYKDAGLPTPPGQFFEQQNLDRLAALMAAHQDIGTVAIPRNPDIPAGFTYFGQFLAHDISMQRSVAGAAPVLQLLSLYGQGPASMPYLYNDYPFLSGKKAYRGAKLRWDPDKRDVYREEKHGFPLMADARNDQHYILSQLHCAFIRFHNMLVEWKHGQPAPDPQKPLSGAALLQAARELFIWHYQWVIVHQYLKLMVYDAGLVDRLLEPGNTQFKLYHVDEPAMLMPEFMQAAMRVGHSQVREVYVVPKGDKHEAGLVRRPIFFAQADREARERAGKEDFHGYRGNPGLYMEWGFYFHSNEKYMPQQSAAIDHFLITPLFDVMFVKTGNNNLIHLDLQRSKELPTGHALAQRLCAALGPDADKHLLSDENPVVRACCGATFHVHDLPLWLYILLEAEINHGGRRLGILGSHILAEQIVWVLRQDASSFVHKKGWQPEKALTVPKRPVFSPRANEPEMAQMSAFNIQDILQFPDFFQSKQPRRQSPGE